MVPQSPPDTQVSGSPSQLSCLISHPAAEGRQSSPLLCTRDRSLHISCLVSHPVPESMQSGFTVGAEMPQVQPRTCLFFEKFDLPLHDAPSSTVFLCQRVTSPELLQHGASTPPPPYTSQDHRARPIQLPCLISHPAAEEKQSSPLPSARYRTVTAPCTFPTSYHILLQSACSPVSQSVQKCHTCSPDRSVFPEI